MRTQAEREAEVAELIGRAQDPSDIYDGHHGTDRSPESLARLKDNDPETYARVMGKIERGE